MPEWFRMKSGVMVHGRHFTIVRIDEAKQTFHVVEVGKDKWLRFAFKEWAQFDPAHTVWDKVLDDPV